MEFSSKEVCSDKEGVILLVQQQWKCPKSGLQGYMAGHCLERNLNLSIMVENPVSFLCYAKTTSKKVKQRSSMAVLAPPHATSETYRKADDVSAQCMMVGLSTALIL